MNIHLHILMNYKLAIKCLDKFHRKISSQRHEWQPVALFNYLRAVIDK